MDDAGEPPKDPKSDVYPDICSDVQVRGRCVRLYENVSSLQYLHGTPSLITTPRGKSAHARRARRAPIQMVFKRLTEEYSHGREESVLLQFALNQIRSKARVAQKTYMARKYRARSLGDDG